MKELIGVINERGELVGLFNSVDFAEAFIFGLHAEQITKVGAVFQEYTSMPVNWSNVPELWK